MSADSETPLRFSFVFPRSDAMGGAVVHIRDLALRLNGEGHEVEVLLGGDGPVASLLRSQGITVRSLKYLCRDPAPLRDLLAVWELRKAFRRFAPDVISTHCAKAGFVGRIAAIATGKRAFYTPHCWSFAEGAPRRRFYAILERLVAPLSARIFCVADFERKEALENRICGESKLEVIHNGMPDVEPGLRANPGSDPVRMVMVARFEPQKDHETLFKALARIRRLDWSIDLIGGGPARGRYEAEAARLGIADRVRFVGEVSNVADYLQRAHVYLLISHWEGFPRSILEAMRAGLPIVASDVGGTREVFVTGEEGYCVARQSEDELVRVLEELIGSSSIRDRRGKASRETYERRFTFDRMYGRYRIRYSDTIAGGDQTVQALKESLSFAEERGTGSMGETR